jgi:hypothetical protein
MAQSSLPDIDGGAPAHVAYVDGAASLEREGRTENAPLNMPLLSGDRLRTGDGRVEVLFPDGSTLHLDARTTIDVQSDELVRLIDGRVRFNILGAGDRSSITYRVDSPAGSARITQAGEYRIALLHGQEETQLELAVLRGAAEVFTDQGTTPVRAGERAYASAGLAPSYAYAYNSATWDTFDRWSENRRDTRLGVSTQYLPAEMRTYASMLDESGDWRYSQPYGYVWYPRVVADWRPYYYGRWASYPRYGWTWIGADRFAWPTHHYGRWGVSAGVWFWIPGSRWAPAYVSWGYAPGYVSWCPLGFDNRAVIGLNIFNGGSRYYPSRAWTSISNSYFGRDYVHHRAVNWDRFDRSRRPNFAERGVAPGLGRDLAVGRSPIRNEGMANNFPGNGAGRSATPIRSAGSRDAALQPGVSRGIGQGDGRSVPRGAMTPATPANSSPGIRRGQQSPRDTAIPRYVNRGDEIVRSPTERPTPPRQQAPAAAPQGGFPVRDGYAAPRQQAPAAAPQGGFPARDGYAVPRRTAPETAARPIDPRVDVRSDPRIAQPRAYEPRGGLPSAPGGMDGRRQDPSVYQPRSEARPRAPGGYESAPRQPDPSVRQAPSSPPPAAREAQGRAEPIRPSSPPPPAGGHIEGRQPPPDRAAPRSAPRETAVPRDAGRPATSGGGASRRGGRGGQ